MGRFGRVDDRTVLARLGVRRLRPLAAGWWVASADRPGGTVAGAHASGTGKASEAAMMNDLLTVARTVPARPHHLAAPPRAGRSHRRPGPARLRLRRTFARRVPWWSPGEALDRASRAAARAMFRDREVEVTSFRDEGSDRIVYRVADRADGPGAGPVAARRAAAVLRQRAAGAGRAPAGARGLSGRERAAWRMA